MNYDNQETVIQNIKDYGKLIDETIAIIPLLPPIKGGKLYDTCQPGRLSIKAPYNLAEYRKFRWSLGQWWERSNAVFSQDSGSLYVEFRHKKLKVALTITFYFPTEKLEGASCHLEQVGEITKPVYKVVCDG